MLDRLDVPRRCEIGTDYGGPQCPHIAYWSLNGAAVCCSDLLTIAEMNGDNAEVIDGALGTCEYCRAYTVIVHPKYCACVRHEALWQHPLVLFMASLEKIVDLCSNHLSILEPPIVPHEGDLNIDGELVVLAGYAFLFTREQFSDHYILWCVYDPLRVGRGEEVGVR